VPALTQSRRRHHSRRHHACIFDRDERRENGDAAHEVARPIDGVDDQARAVLRRRLAFLFAENSQLRRARGHQIACHGLDGAVGFAHRRSVVLVVDA
jgi:hypothetical protein